MKLTNRTSSTVTANHYYITYQERELLYIEFLDENKKLTNAVLCDKNGNEVNDGNNLGFANVAAVLEEVQQFVGNLE